MLMQQTSIDAYKSINRGNNSMKDRVYDLIKEYELISCEEAEIYLEGKHQSISSTIRHLVLDGLVENSLLTTKNTSGRMAILWKTVDQT
jgi:hypothetical protein